MSNAVEPWQQLQEHENEALPRQRAEALPEALRGSRALQRAIDSTYQPIGGAVEEAALAVELKPVLTGLGDEDRRMLFSTVFPRLAADLEGAWRNLASFPIVSGRYELGSRAPFRSPRGAEVLAEHRTGWFIRVCGALCKHDPNPKWLAEWISHMYDWDGTLASVVAATLNRGGAEADECLEILKASAVGKHPIGQPGFSVIASMLMSERPDAWTFVEGLLLKAGREEGLRQAILESAHLAHPQAFRRFLKVILDENLVRFSSVVRAADVWFGLLWDSMSAGHVNEQIAQVLRYLTDENARDAALTGKDANAAYLSLWAAAFDDVAVAERMAAGLLKHPKAEMRYVAVHLLAQMGLARLAPLIGPALADEDLRVAARAADYFRHAPLTSPDREECFGQVEALFRRVSASKPIKLKPIVWPWTARTVGAREIGAPLVSLMDAATAERLIPHLNKLSAYDRACIAGHLGRIEGWTDDEGRADGGASPITEGARQALVGLLGDSAEQVRSAAFAGLGGRPPLEDEVRRLESLLDRKAADLRTGALARLAEQEGDSAVESARRLIADRNTDRRRAGVELLQLLVKSGRCASRVGELVAEIGAGSGGIGKELREELVALRDLSRPAATLEDCLGLLDRAGVTPPPRLVDRGFPSMTATALRLVLDLDEFIEHHKEAVIPASELSDEKDLPLGAAREWQLRRHVHGTDGKRSWSRIVVPELWVGWHQGRAAELRDPDGLELTRALLAIAGRAKAGWAKPSRWPSGFKGLLGGRIDAKLRYEDHLKVVIEWLMQEHGPKGWMRLVLDAMETAIARGRVEAEWSRYDGIIPERRTEELDFPFEWWGKLLDDMHAHQPSDEEDAHLWLLYRAVDDWGARVWSPRRVKELASASRKPARTSEEPPEYIPRPGCGTVIAAMRAGAATTADLVYYMLHAHPGEMWRDRGFETLTDPKELAEVKPPAGVPELVDRVVARIVGLELERGDAATATTKLTRSLERSGGMGVALGALARLGSLKLARSGFRWHDDKASVFSNLILKSRPLAGETPGAFKKAAAELGVGEERLVQLAVYAPVWAGRVEGALGWTGLVDAVWWIHAHTKDNEWRLEEDLSKAREAAIAERTPLAADELSDGAVDVAWFHRAYKGIGAARWERVYAEAKYACSGIGHKRAQLFADAMLGRLKEKELTARIQAKRHQDSIRALGLLPLKAGAKAQVLSRYKVMQEVRRTSRKHGGSMLQASEKRAVEIGMENLARSAGYPDPVRLQWAMEAEAVADLAKGPVTVKAGVIAVTLAIDDDGAPALTVVKEGKPLAAVPPKLKKEPKIAALTERVRELRRQASRMRQSLEQAMCRGDRFTGAELAELFKHPVLRPMLQRLVFVGGKLAGYPDKGGRVLRSHDGSLEPLKASDELRLAHPHDLLASRAWPRWQRECFAAERVQPFKQVFRELYVPTERERTDELRSTRYAGHQVQPRQALALLGGRGWVIRPEGGVQRTFHAERLTAWLEFDEHFHTPAEVEGLTLEAVRFSTAGGDEPVKLGKVPARVFSEVMRDLDLVVSVAHRGGVDPEASESTVEARASLLRETCRLLKLDNVSIKGARAGIRGELGEYSVHLGSATVQMMPGGAIWIVPVHAQHRGRIFLPFADEDPRTAEVISKVLLLARDSEIKDPAIRQQIAGRG